MWQLSKILFRSVGHADARFDPLVLDLTGPEGGPAHTTLWLENGGGKTSALALALSVVRPNAHEFLTAKKGRHLGDYVAAGDVAHVVLELHRPEPSLLGEPARILIGQVLAWKDLRPSEDTSALRRRWWGTRVDDHVHAGTLPFTDGNGSRSMRDFCDELARMVDARPHLEAQPPTDHQGRWEQWLQTQGIDPTMWRDILRINSDEGAIAEAFGFVDGNDAVRYFLDTAGGSDTADEVARTIEGLAEQLHSRPRLQDEQDLCDSATGHLRELAAAHALAADADAALTAARQAAAILSQQMVVASTLAAEDADRHRDDAAAYEQVDREANATQRTLGRQAVRARQMAAQLRLDTAKVALKALEDAAASADAERAAWALTGSVAEHGQATRDLERVRELLGALDDTLAPLRRQADEAATHLAVEAHLRVEELTAANADHDAARARAELDLAQADQDMAVARAAERAARERLTQAQTRLATLDEQVDAAVADGLVRVGESLRAAVADAQAALQQAVDAHEVAVGRRVQLLNKRGGVSEELDEAHRQAAAADGAVAAAVGKREDMLRERDRLASDPLLQEATDTTEPDPLTLPDGVVGRLRDLAAQARTSAVQAEVQIADSVRVGDAISRTGLAPTVTDVERAVAHLNANGIVAHTGWRFMADSLPADRHEALQRAAPHLPSAVVVAHDADLAAAAERLAEHVEANPSAVPLVVTSRSHVHAMSDGGEPGGEVQVVVAHAALHDPDVAAAFHADLNVSAQSARDRAAAGSSRAAKLDRVAGALLDLRDRWPDPDAIREQAAAAVVAAEEASQAVVDLTATRDRLDDELAAADSEVEDAVALRHDAQGRADRLAALQKAQAGRSALEAAVESAQQEISVAMSAQERADAAASQARDTAMQARQDRRDGDRTIEGIRELCSRMKVQMQDGSVPERVGLDERERTVVELRAKMARERDDSGLDAEAERLRGHLATLDVTLGSVPADTRMRASALLATCTNVTERVRRTREADAAALKIRERLGAQQGEVERHTTLLATLKEEESRPLPDEGLPTDADGFERLAVQLEHDANQARAERKTAEDNARDARLAEKSVRDRAELLKDWADDLAGLDGVTVVEQPDTVPFTGADPAARAREVRTTVGACARQVTDAEALRAEEHAALQRLLLEPRFQRFAADATTAPIVAQLTAGSAAQVGEHAARFARELTERSESIRADLAAISSHQRMLVTQLASVAVDALGLLHSLQLRSRMPDDLGGWSQQEFLTISHADAPDGDMLTERMVGLMDRIVNGTMAADGNTLRYEAARAAVGGDGFTVRILKPHTELRRDRVDVAELAGFSGGQRLTAAVALFLTMMNLRLSATGSARANQARSVLLLDNPFGKSSADAFVNLQTRLADRLNVQLVYTTAVKDLGALSHFGRVIRLTHGRHSETGRSHVVEDAAMGGQGSQIVAASLVRQPRPLAVVADVDDAAVDDVA